MKSEVSGLSLADTIPSGQCFRFSVENGVWTIFSGVDSSVRSIAVSQDTLDEAVTDPFWHRFFDMDSDYDDMKASFSKVSPIMAQACAYAPGIRILQQDSWEALCSFVVSQNNNIKRIMGIVAKMCASFGKCNEDGVHGFPSSATLASASEDDLRALGLGFRAPYIVNTARAVEDGKIDFEKLKSIPVDEARKTLMQVKGIGPKVADCALLFGCHRLDCFPVDVWIRRVMEKCFPGCDASVFGEYAGVAQQYLFHWARTSGCLDA